MFKPGVKATQITRPCEGEGLRKGERREGLRVDGKRERKREGRRGK